MPCDACQAPAELFLCNLCVTDLAGCYTALHHGPGRSQGLLANLADVTLKRTRLGAGTGHRKRGDEMPGLYEPDTVNGRRTKQGEAGMLLGVVADTLNAHISWLCDARGIDPPTISKPAKAALWLAGNSHAIACSEFAGKVHADITGFVKRIERVIDRPEPLRLIGQCPAPHPKDDQKRCATGLQARRDAIEVRCPTCKTTHNVERVKIQNFNEVSHQRFPAALILRALAELDEPIPSSTLYDWIKTGKLKCQGYRRPPLPGETYARIGATRHSDADKPVYRLSDVRRLRSEQPTRKVRAG